MLRSPFSLARSLIVRFFPGFTKASSSPLLLSEFLLAGTGQQQQLQRRRQQTGPRTPLSLFRSRAYAGCQGRWLTLHTHSQSPHAHAHTYTHPRTRNTITVHTHPRGTVDDLHWAPERAIALALPTGDARPSKSPPLPPSLCSTPYTHDNRLCLFCVLLPLIIHSK